MPMHLQSTGRSAAPLHEPQTCGSVDHIWMILAVVGINLILVPAQASFSFHMLAMYPLHPCDSPSGDDTVASSGVRTVRVTLKMPVGIVFAQKDQKGPGECHVRGAGITQ